MPATTNPAKFPRSGPRTPVDAARVATVRSALISHNDAHHLAELLSLIADPARARILHALDTVDELCVGDLVLALEMTEDATGYALRVLRTAGFVSGRRTGRMVYYRITDAFPGPLREHCLRRLTELVPAGPAAPSGRSADRG